MSPRARKQRDHARDVLDDARLDALGRLVEQQQARARHQGAGERKLLLLTPRQIPAAPAQHGFQDGEQLEHLVRHAPLAARQDGKAGFQVLAHAQQREDVAPLRHPGNTAPRPLMRGQAGDIGALPPYRTGADRARAHDRAQQTCLADAVAPEQARHGARPRIERHAPQCDGGAVMEGD